MKPHSIEQSWQDILSITKTMEQSAADEQWNEVAINATERHKMIEIHFKKYAVGPDTAEFYYQHLSQFLSKEEELKTLANENRKKALKQNLTLVSNKKAVGAYQSGVKASS